jgi:hypothetical protein
MRAPFRGSRICNTAVLSASLYYEEFDQLSSAGWAGRARAGACQDREGEE